MNNRQCKQLTVQMDLQIEVEIVHCLLSIVLPAVTESCCTVWWWGERKSFESVGGAGLGQQSATEHPPLKVLCSMDSSLSRVLLSTSVGPAPAVVISLSIILLSPTSCTGSRGSQDGPGLLSSCLLLRCCCSIQNVWCHHRVITRSGGPPAVHRTWASSAGGLCSDLSHMLLQCDQSSLLFRWTPR